LIAGLTIELRGLNNKNWKNKIAQQQQEKGNNKHKKKHKRKIDLTGATKGNDLTLLYR
jgi:hypothetical protein